MQDAQSAHPICGDEYAEAFMNDEGRAVFEAFADDTNPNTSNVARHRIVDDVLRCALAKHPNLTVVLVGAGFDSRAYRLSGGTWIELDEPAVIAYKNERLPLASCQNALNRIPIDFATESLADKLAKFAGRAPTVVVIEGVFMYLEASAIEQLLATLRKTFPSHTLVCDLMTRKFFEKYSRPLHEKIVGLGASFGAVPDDPEKAFLAAGYRRISRQYSAR